MADDKGSNKWQILSIAFVTGTFIITLFRYMSDEEGKILTKEIDKLRLQEMRDKQAEKLAAKIASSSSQSLPASEDNT